MADVDLHDRVSRLERTLAVVVQLMHNGLNEEARAALEATGFSRSMAGASQGLTQAKAA